MKIRKPVVAGRFYPAEKESIIDQLEKAREREFSSMNLNLIDRSIIGGVVPHAGYMFSSYEAVHFFELIKTTSQEFETVVIINPNHTGLGHEMAVDSHGIWETPLGEVPVDVEFVEKLGISISDIEQKHEHSGEVMVPMLQYFLDYDFKIVPITLSSQTFKNAKYLAAKILKSAEKLNRKILIIASSDFSHFLSPEEGRKRDEMVLEQILKLNSESIENVIRDEGITVCGYGPIMTLIEYSKLITSKPQVDILKIGHSGEIIPSREVVDYVSILFSDTSA
jgi:MEMO1 family protein